MIASSSLSCSAASLPRNRIAVVRRLRWPRDHLGFLLLSGQDGKHYGENQGVSQHHLQEDVQNWPLMDV